MLQCVMVLVGVVTGPGLVAVVDRDRVAPLPDATAWRGYLDRSERLATLDADTLAAEASAVGRPTPLQAPSGGDFRPSPSQARDDTWLKSEAAARLTEAVISFQTPSGGWSKHTAYATGPRRRGMQWTSQNAPGRRPHYLATFDNGATTQEIAFLAAVGDATNRDDCREAVRRGLEYVLAAQYPNGGWPQVYPLEGGYHDAVTLNDDAMTNVLEILHAASGADRRFAFLDPELKRRLAAALHRGVDCVIAMQVTVAGRKTVWCAQHDPITLQPTAARAFEPASLSGVESARLLKFLMSLPRPAPDLVACIDSGLTWLASARVTGLARLRQNGRMVYVADASATGMYWARFYDLTTGKPIFPGKDGRLYPSFEALATASDELGYDYYSSQPGSILGTKQDQWRKRLEGEQ